MSVGIRVRVSLIARLAVGIRESAPGQSCPHYLLSRPRSRLNITFRCHPGVIAFLEFLSTFGSQDP